MDQSKHDPGLRLSPKLLLRVLATVPVRYREGEPIWITAQAQAPSPPSLNKGSLQSAEGSPDLRLLEVPGGTSPVLLPFLRTLWVLLKEEKTSLRRLH